MVTSGPREEKKAIWSPSSMALTAMAPGALAGDSTKRPLLPAAHTTVAPRRRA